MRNYIFTFGHGQAPHGIGTYTIVIADSWEEARKKMYANYGNRWCMQYESADDAGVEKYGLKCVGVIA